MINNHRKSRFEQLDENTYSLGDDLSYCRFGGREDFSGIDPKDLGFVDPSGGPFIQLGDEIDGRKITRIMVVPDTFGEDRVFFEVSPST